MASEAYTGYQPGSTREVSLISPAVPLSKNYTEGLSAQEYQKKLERLASNAVQTAIRAKMLEAMKSVLRLAGVAEIVDKKKIEPKGKGSNLAELDAFRFKERIPGNTGHEDPEDEAEYLAPLAPVKKKERSRRRMDTRIKTSVSVVKAMQANNVPSGQILSVFAGTTAGEIQSIPVAIPGAVRQAMPLEIPLTHVQQVQAREQGVIMKSMPQEAVSQEALPFQQIVENMEPEPVPAYVPAQVQDTELPLAAAEQPVDANIKIPLPAVAVPQLLAEASILSPAVVPSVIQARDLAPAPAPAPAMEPAPVTAEKHTDNSAAFGERMGAYMNSSFYEPTAVVNYQALPLAGDLVEVAPVMSAVNMLGGSLSQMTGKALAGGMALPALDTLGFNSVKSVAYAGAAFPTSLSSFGMSGMNGASLGIASGGGMPVALAV